MRALLLRVAALLAVLLAAVQLGTGDPAGAAPGPVLTVAGNALLVDGRPARLAGVNRSGSEYACAQGWGIFDGPVDDASIAAIRSWQVDAVRLPLNESCWLGVGGVAAPYAGAAYQRAVRGYVDRLAAHGLAVVLDLHWTRADEAGPALGQAPMPDAGHAVTFWSQVAAAYRDAPGVAFELFNEPHDVDWACWRDGCTMPGGWAAAGMQQLLDAVRAAGARQPVIIDGLDWANDLSGWLTHPLRDPLGQLVAGWHAYNRTRCATVGCWEQTVLPVAAVVPVLLTELGEYDCGQTFTRQLLDWADAHALGYLAWTWDAWPDCSGPTLIRDYAGTPTAYGAAYRDHLAQRAATGPAHRVARRARRG